MVKVNEYKIRHPWVALFVWGGVVAIVIGATTDPFIGNRGISAFLGLYGGSFVLFGALVYLTLFIIGWYSKKSRSRS